MEASPLSWTWQLVAAARLLRKQNSYCRAGVLECERRPLYLPPFACRSRLLFVSEPDGCHRLLLGSKLVNQQGALQTKWVFSLK